MTTTSQPPLDRRRNAYRFDIASEALRGRVSAQRFVPGTAAQVVRSSAAVRREPRADAAVETEALFGETATIFERASGWAWAQLDRDGYVGYLDETALSEAIMPPTHRIAALGTYAYRQPDIKSVPLQHLALNAAICVDGYEGGMARLATGGYVVRRHVADWDRYQRDFVDIAERFVGTPYLWGGRTRLGIDCSGLVQVALEATGVAAPRDSDMQAAELGQPIPVPADLEGLERGDLVCWAGHIGIMVDGIMLVHANAHHMTVVVEPLPEAAARIARTGSAITAIRRLPVLTADSIAGSQP